MTINESVLSFSILANQKEKSNSSFSTLTT